MLTENAYRKCLQKMLAEYQAPNNVPQEVCDQILEAAKESSVFDMNTI